MILSSQVLSSPKCCRMDLTCSKASLSLEKGWKEGMWRQKRLLAFAVVSERPCVLLPLYLWEELCFKDASSLECFRNLSTEQESSLGHIYQDVPYNFPQIHAAAHLLISVVYLRATNEGLTLQLVFLTRKTWAFTWLCTWVALWPLFAGIEGEVIHHSVVLCPDVIKATIVSESPPLHIDTHLSLFSLYHLNILHLLHVTGIAPSACNRHTNTSHQWRTETRISVYKNELINGKLTSNQPDLTGGLLIGTGHHGSYCIIDNSHHIQVKLLQRDTDSSIDLQAATFLCCCCSSCPTSLLLIASLSSPTTSSPSQSVALNPLVHVTRIPCARAHTSIFFRKILAFCCHSDKYNSILWG